jgi:hypothetical protein
MKFTFQNDENSRLFCEKIVEAMELLYDIDPAKGCELLNDRWGGFDWRQNSEKKDFTYLLFHETELSWAGRIGNPCPDGGPESELVKWRARENEAERRIEAFFHVGQHDWLWPPGWLIAWKQLNDRANSGS